MDRKLRTKRGRALYRQGVGETPAGIVLAELPQPNVLGLSAVAAFLKIVSPDLFFSCHQGAIAKSKSV